MILVFVCIYFLGPGPLYGARQALENERRLRAEASGDLHVRRFGALLGLVIGFVVSGSGL